MIHSAAPGLLLASLNPGQMGWYGFALGIGALGLALAWVSWFLCREAARGPRILRRMAQFAEVTGEIVESRVASHSTRWGTLIHTPFVRYDYSVAGRVYRSQRILPVEFAPSADRVWADQWVATYPVGMTVTVFYDPERPADALLERRTENVAKNTTDLYLGVVLLGLTSLSLLILMGWLVLNPPALPAPETHLLEAPTL